MERLVLARIDTMANTMDYCKSKDEERAEIAAQVDAYISNGGVIYVCSDNEKGYELVDGKKYYKGDGPQKWSIK